MKKDLEEPTNMASLNPMEVNDTSVAMVSKCQILEGIKAIDSFTEPYTMAELHSRIDDSEAQISRGEVLETEEVERQMNALIASWN